MTKEELTLEVIRRLKVAYPLAECTLDYDQAWKLLVSVRLAAQCTDARVNVVVEGLYEKYPDVASLAAADVTDIEEIVRPCGLGKSKARDISACMKILHEQYHDKVPDDFNALLKLPGVGRKSANLIMGDVFGKPALFIFHGLVRAVKLHVQITAGFFHRIPVLAAGRQLHFAGGDGHVESIGIGAHIGVADNVLHNFTKGQSHDGQIVAPQTQHGNADQKAHQTGQDAAANHSAQQPQGVAGDIILQHRSDDDAGEGTDAHKTSMAQAQFPADAHQQVQRNRQGNIHTNGNQIPPHGAAQHAGGIQTLHDHKGHDYHQIGQQIGAGIFVFQNRFHRATSHLLLNLLAQQASRLHQQDND